MSPFLPRQFSAVEDEPRPVIALSDQVETMALASPPAVTKTPSREIRKNRIASECPTIGFVESPRFKMGALDENTWII
jgi:hypothetical protein